MISLASKTAGLITGHLFDFLRQSPCGELFPEQTFQSFPVDPDLIRRPDIAFIATARLGGVPEEGHVPIAPDLAIEVVSPNDKIYDLDEKLANYRAAGVKLVWVVNPKSRTNRIHRPGQAIVELAEADTLTADPILPGFAAKVADLLPKPPPAHP